MDLTQFPTVETLPPQGKSVNELVVAEWSKVKNWAYVVLSRVRSLAGLTTWDRNRLLTENAFETRFAYYTRIGDTN
jgi:hypothetical protein